MDYKSNKPGFTDTDIWYNNTTNWTTKHHIAYYMVSVNALEAKSRHDANFVGPCDIGAAMGVSICLTSIQVETTAI